MIKLGDMIDVSTVDWPGKPATALFLAGCNFRCPFCFNANLAFGNEYREIEIDTIVAGLSRHKDFISAVVLTGGEPTLQDIVPLCRKLKGAGFEIKIDTNGSRPEVVEQILNEKIVDFVALDVKGPVENYARVCGIENQAYGDAVKRTLASVIKSGVSYECRSPIVPGVNADEASLRAHAESVKDAKVFVLEQFWAENGTIDPNLKDVKGLTHNEMIAAARFFKNSVVKIRTREAGEEIIKR